jgi:hypothetical protein
MAAADSLAAWGIVNAAQVVAIAGAVGLDLAVACTILEKESGGGQNVWGHDGVDPGGTYVKGAPVTQADYLAYRGKLKAGLIKAQGVGPCQLTWSGYQEAADKLAGCWDWHSNCTVGFQAIRDLQRSKGIRGGFIAYNGAAKYADDPVNGAMVLLDRWRTRLGAAGAITPNATTEEDDMPYSLDEIADAVVAKLVPAVTPAVVSAVMSTTLWDLYPEGQPTRTMTFADTVAWAAANAGRANTEAHAVGDDVISLRADLLARLDTLDARIAAVPSPGAGAAPVIAGSYHLVPNMGDASFATPAEPVEDAPAAEAELPAAGPSASLFEPPAA